MQTILQCLVVDDEPLAAKLISTYVERTPFLALAAEVYTPEDAIARINSGGIDLIFMDIHMPRLSGMQLAKLIPDSVRIVFTTAYSDYAVEGFRVHALDYLLKPVSYDEFLEAANRALEDRETRQVSATAVQATTTQQDFLVVKSEYRLLRLAMNDIVYIEGLKDYVKINLASDSKPVLTLMSMKALEEALPENRFVRVHRSFIVNMDCVRVIERNSIILAGRCIPVSESYRRRFFSLLGMDS
jgi:two component transcriptional regulator, lytTR family